MLGIPTTPVRQAIVLAAGNGDRFHNGSRQSKLLAPVGGTPLLLRTLLAIQRAGIIDAHLVLGYDAAQVRAWAASHAPDGLQLHFHLNHQWHRENGLSVLTARRAVARQPFALLMGDHLFEPAVLRRLLRTRREPGEVLLGIDRHPRDPSIADEATRVRVRDGRVIAIGKGLMPYDALDTGLFVCHASVFEALEESCADGDTTLSGGIERLASRGLVRGVAINHARWCDIDTVDDLERAEALVAASRAGAAHP